MTTNAQPNDVQNELRRITFVMMGLRLTKFPALRTAIRPDHQSKVEHGTDQEMGIVAILVELFVLASTLFDLLTVLGVVAIRDIAGNLRVRKAITLNRCDGFFGIQCSPSARTIFVLAFYGAKFSSELLRFEDRGTLNAFGHDSLLSKLLCLWPTSVYSGRGLFLCSV